MKKWTIDDARELYNINGWGTSYFGINEKGDVYVTPSKDGAQIDLLIERADHVINMCEMKFYGEEFTVNKSYYQKLSQRQKILSEQLKKRQIIHSTLVTTYGLKYNEYSGAFQRVIKMDALFQ